MKNPKVFISYASEDDAMAKVIHHALLEILRPELENELEVIQDIHTFKLGNTLKDSIIEHLESADFLFIIFTERLKKSHSYTGFEIGAFRVLMHQDFKTQKRTDRRIVSMYFDEPPASEKDMLGIRLDVRALGGIDEKSKAVFLDRSGGLDKFFNAVVELYVRRRFEEWDPELSALSRKASEVLEKKKVVVKSKVMPFVIDGLIKAFSSLIASSSIEQLLIEVRWDASAKSNGTDNSVFVGSDLIASKSDAFRIFGIPKSDKSLSWEAFKAALLPESNRHGAFILSAMEDAARSALSPERVDNEQFLSLPKETCIGS